MSTVPAQDDQSRRERRWLLRSIGATAALGSVGIVWGIASGSQMILLDGVYAGVGILVSALLLWASALAQQETTRRFPYGRAAVTPLAIGVQGVVLLFTLAYAAAEAIFTIRAGGSNVSAGPAIAYGVLATAVSLLVWLWLRRAAGHSDLLIAEAIAWRVGGMRGAGMIVGFSAMGLLTGSSWHGAVPYIDPGMVLLTCTAFVPAPIGMIRRTLVELLEGAPAAEVQAAVDEAVAAVRRVYDLDPPSVRTTKVGPKLYVELEGVAGADVTLAQEHEVRQDLRRRLDSLPYDVWLNVELYPRDERPALPDQKNVV